MNKDYLFLTSSGAMPLATKINEKLGDYKNIFHENGISIEKYISL